MKGFGGLLGAAVVAGAGLAYYVHQRHKRTGMGYLDIVRQLPGDVEHVTDEARRRAAEALENGIAAAKRREADLVKRLEAAGAPAESPASASGFGQAPVGAASPVGAAAPAAEMPPSAVSASPAV